MLRLSNIKGLCLVALSALTLAGCGEAHKAHSRVEDFMAASMAAEDCDIVGWTEMKTTHSLSDSVLHAIRTRATESGLVKPGAQYAARSPRLRFVQVRCAVNGDTLRRTFYLDEQLSGVVGVKEN